MDGPFLRTRKGETEWRIHSHPRETVLSGGSCTTGWRAWRSTRSSPRTSLSALLPGIAWSSVYSAFRRAVREVEISNLRTFASVRGTGYRMVAAAEDEGLARGHHRKSRRQLVKATQKLEAADRSLLTPEERRRFETMEQNLQAQHDFVRRLDARTIEMQKVLHENRSDVAVLSEKVERLEQAVEASRHVRGIQHRLRQDMPPL